LHVFIIEVYQLLKFYKTLTQKEVDLEFNYLNICHLT